MFAWSFEAVDHAERLHAGQSASSFIPVSTTPIRTTPTRISDDGTAPAARPRTRLALDALPQQWRGGQLRHPPFREDETPSGRKSTRNPAICAGFQVFHGGSNYDVPGPERPHLLSLVLHPPCRATLHI